MNDLAPKSIRDFYRRYEREAPWFVELEQRIINTIITDCNITETMRAYAQMGMHLLETFHNRDIKYDKSLLKLIDRYLEFTQLQEPPLGKVGSVISIGAVLGELICKKFDGTWNYIGRYKNQNQNHPLSAVMFNKLSTNPFYRADRIAHGSKMSNIVAYNKGLKRILSSDLSDNFFKNKIEIWKNTDSPSIPPIERFIIE